MPSPVALAEQDETPMERAVRERAEDAARARQQRAQKTPREARGLFARLASTLDGGLFDLAPQSCESNYDCERPEVCCDLMFGTVCCNGGMMIPTTDGAVALQPQAIPIPVEKDNGLPGGMAPRNPGGPSDMW